MEAITIIIGGIVISAFWLGCTWFACAILGGMKGMEDEA